MTKIIFAFITAGLMIVSSGCKSGSDAVVVGGNGKAKSGDAKGKSGDQLGNETADDGQTPVDQTDTQTQTQTQQQTVTQEQQQQEQVTDTNTQTSTETIADKYKGYVKPTTAEIESHKQNGDAQIYNGTKKGIVSANGTATSQVIPPGEYFWVEKFETDEFSTGLDVQRDDGSTCSGSFDTMAVADMQWKANVVEQDGVCTVKQNAGGGGGGGGGGAGLGGTR